MPEDNESEQSEQAQGEQEEEQPTLQTIIFSPIAQVVQIDDFPEDIKRTIKGALHVKPGATRVVTEEEAAHLKARGIHFTVIGQPTKPSKPAPAEESPAPAGRFFQDAQAEGSDNGE